MRVQSTRIASSHNGYKVYEIEAWSARPIAPPLPRSFARSGAHGKAIHVSIESVDFMQVQPTV